MFPGIKMEEFMESENSGIFRVKLITKNVVLGSSGTHFMHMRVNKKIKNVFMNVRKLRNCLRRNFQLYINPLITARCCFSITFRFSDVFRGCRKATPGCNGLKKHGFFNINIWEKRKCISVCFYFIVCIFWSMYFCMQ